MQLKYLIRNPARKKKNESYSMANITTPCSFSHTFYKEVRFSINSTRLLLLDTSERVIEVFGIAGPSVVMLLNALLLIVYRHAIRKQEAPFAMQTVCTKCTLMATRCSVVNRSNIMSSCTAVLPVIDLCWCISNVLYNISSVALETITDRVDVYNK